MDEKVHRHKINASKEFDLEKCFLGPQEHEHGYVKDSDYYYDSYSHFSMYFIVYHQSKDMKKCSRIASERELTGTAFSKIK